MPTKNNEEEKKNWGSHVEAGSEVVAHTDVPEVNISLLAEAKYFATFIHEATNHAGTVHVKSGGEDTDVPSYQVRWVW